MNAFKGGLTRPGRAAGLFVSAAALLWLSLLTAPAALAQTNPDPLTLNIPNIRQENIYWCWAAMAQQVI
ncbi:MAG: hypothetical protein LBS31_11080, partial [Candidatus Adiutrix sp.]|nr:hypothetical protein [Candidatus Adiutrix sp.]